MTDRAAESDFFTQLYEQAAAVPAMKDGVGLTIDNILSGQTYYRKSFMANPLSDLSYYLTVLESGALGFAYHNNLPVQGKAVLDLVDRNPIDILQDREDMDFPLAVSLLDAAYGVHNRLTGSEPQHTLRHGGTYDQKADYRSHLVTGQIESGKKVLLVGLVTQFVRDMLDRDIDVRVSDLSPELEGTNVYGVPIVNSGNAWTLDSLATCDEAIVTGASIATNTVDSIFEVAAASNTRLHFYLETGNNFGPELMRHGAASVIAEKFPFYDFPGETTYEVFTQ